MSNPPSNESGQYVAPTALRRFLKDHFSLDELHELCADLDLDHEAIGGTTKPVFARNLVQYCERRGELIALAELAIQQRPQVVADGIFVAGPVAQPTDNADSEQLQGGTTSVSGGSVYGSAIGTNTGTVNATYNIYNTPPSLVHSRLDYYTHIDMPRNYVAREDVLAQVRTAVLGTGSAVALSSSVKATALHGMGGIGKSAIARALCNDPAIQEAFPEGILWTTLGQTPDLVRKLRDWIEHLGGIVPETAPTAESLKGKLAALLKDRTCLLIIDDAWQTSDAEHFQVSNGRCKLLLTTRDRVVAEELGAAVEPIHPMTPNEAVGLLEEWAGGGPTRR